MSRPTLFAQDIRSTRPSIFVDHVSAANPAQNGGGQHASIPAAQNVSSSSARLQAKRQELDGLTVLKEQSARLAKDIEALGDNVDELVQGGEAVAAVMSSWAGVFRAIHIARGNDEKQVPETLVRLPVESVEHEAKG